MGCGSQGDHVCGEHKSGNGCVLCNSLHPGCCTAVSPPCSQSEMPPRRINERSLQLHLTTRHRASHDTRVNSINKMTQPFSQPCTTAKPSKPPSCSSTDKHIGFSLMHAGQVQGMSMPCTPYMHSKTSQRPDSTCCQQQQATLDCTTRWAVNAAPAAPALQLLLPCSKHTTTTTNTPQQQQHQCQGPGFGCSEQNPSKP